MGPPHNSRTTSSMLFFKSSLYNLEDKRILDKLGVDISEIIQDIKVINFFKIELDFEFV